MRCHTFVFDGDNVRHGLCEDLGLSARDRAENIRRVGELARLFIEAGVIALTAFISPFRSDRARARLLVPDGEFLEIYCRCPLTICEERDVKGLYKRARSGEVTGLTGISSPYEEPDEPELIVDTGHLSLEESVIKVMELLQDRGVITNAA
jgi:adenylylsulfate kinase